MPNPMTKLPAFTPSFTASTTTTSIARWGTLLSRTSQISSSQHKVPIVPPSTARSRTLAQVRSEPFSELWFTAAAPTNKATKETGKVTTISTSDHLSGDGPDHKQPDERTLKLGKTLRALSPLLPTILTTPLPNKLLSRNITLHLFPSTHPHLPVVKGRVPYQAALWTAPVAWGSVPIVGNVKLDIQSEKMVRTGLVSAPTVPQTNETIGEEKLVVRWRTEAKTDSNASTSTSAHSSSLSTASDNGGVNRGLSKLLGGDQPLFKSTSSEPFTGLFVFSFDQHGKIASMTIEHADESHGCDKTSRMVTLTDWLLSRAKWGRAKEEEVLVPGLAISSEQFTRRFRWFREQTTRKDDHDNMFR